MLVGADDLEQILDQTLGGLRDFVDQRTVSIDPGSSACYVRVSLTSSALAQLGGSCRLDGCSAVIYDRQQVALRDFDVAGCDALFSAFGVSRHVPSKYADASARIRQHCGAADFEIAGVKVVRIDGVPTLKFQFRPAAAQR